jgi:hypothetical protein
LLHPVRLRIVKAFLGDRALTTSQLAAEVDDVPAASLYRHVALLTEAGVLQVVAERRVRGTVERTYVLRLSAASVGPAEAAAMSADEHSQAFRVFIAGLVSDFDRYLARGQPDLLRDGVSYSGAAMWLSDDEYREFLRGVATLVQPLQANPPRPGRKRRMVYSVFLPAPEETRTSQPSPSLPPPPQRRRRTAKSRDEQR